MITYCGQIICLNSILIINFESKDCSKVYIDNSKNRKTEMQSSILISEVNRRTSPKK